jgi:hypothetical protein
MAAYLLPKEVVKEIDLREIRQKGTKRFTSKQANEKASKWSPKIRYMPDMVLDTGEVSCPFLYCQISLKTLMLFKACIPSIVGPG